LIFASNGDIEDTNLVSLQRDDMDIARTLGASATKLAVLPEDINIDHTNSASIIESNPLPQDGYEHIYARLEARMDESITTINARCNFLEKCIEEYIEVGQINYDSYADISRRFQKMLSDTSLGIIESTQEMAKGVAKEFAGQIDKSTKLVASLEARLVQLEKAGETVNTAIATTDSPNAMTTTAATIDVIVAGPTEKLEDGNLRNRGAPDDKVNCTSVLAANHGGQEPVDICINLELKYYHFRFA